MPEYDATYLPRWAQRQMVWRFHIWRPVQFREVVASYPQAEVYGEPWLTNVPGGKRPARTGNEPYLIGSVEKDLILTYDLLFFPADVHLESDYFCQDVTLVVDFHGNLVPGEKYGQFYSIRGETSDWIPTPLNKCHANRVPAIAERNPPPGATGYVTPVGAVFVTV